MPTTEIIFIRHGETEWNRENRFQGGTDIHLNEQGHEQARRVARRLAGLPVAALYCSDLTRARQTAEPIARALGLSLSVEPALRERSYGIFEGRTHEDMVREFPDIYESWRLRDARYAIPGGGESLFALRERVFGQMEQLARRHAGQLVAAVTHGGVLDAVYRLVTATPGDIARTFPIPNAGINRIGWDGERFAVIDWGDVAHLGSLTSLATPHPGSPPPGLG
jgi:probable phosphoglycerate mutase